MSKHTEVLKNHSIKKNSLIAYFTFGDPSIEQTKTIVMAAVRAGADVIELGMPFSDPIADGPVIQASHQRALEAKSDISFNDLFQFMREVKPSCQVPFVVMTDVNLVIRFGIKAFFEQAAQVGIEGVILPNVPIEEMAVFLPFSHQYGIAIIQLVSFLCPEERLQKIVSVAQGFLYVIASTGTTGVRATLSDQLPRFVARIQAIRDVPVAVGFGISTPEQTQAVWSYAQGAIVGSVLVQIVAQTSGDQLATCVEQKIKWLKRGELR